MYCRSCGAQNPEGAAICAVCSKPISGQPATSPQPIAHGGPYIVQPKKTSTLAIVSLVLGILAFFCFGITSLFGVICGVIALNQINRDEKYEGKGIAIAGTILSGVSFAFLSILLAILFPVFAQAREKAKEESCMTNQRYLSRAMLMYAQDHNESLPPNKDWCDLITPYITDKKIFQCPSADSNTNNVGKSTTYAYNSHCNHLNILKVNMPSITPMTFDAKNSKWNQSGGDELVACRHVNKTVMSFLDGHVESKTPEEARETIWDPMGFWHPDPSRIRMIPTGK